GIPGIDAKKPLGVYVLEPKNGAPLPPVVGFIPVTKEEDFFDALAKLHLEVSKPDDKGIRSIDVPRGGTVYVRATNGHLYASNEKSHIEGKLQDPADLLLPINKTALFAGRFRFDRPSRDLKQDIIKNLRGNEPRKKRRGESETEHEVRLAFEKSVEDALIGSLLESKDLTVSLEVDQKRSHIAFDLSLRAITGSNTAAQFKNFGKL